MSKPEQAALFVTIPTAAKQLGVGVARLARAIRAGQVPSVTIGAQKMVPRAALQRLAQVEKVSA